MCHRSRAASALAVLAGAVLAAACPARADVYFYTNQQQYRNDLAAFGLGGNERILLNQSKLASTGNPVQGRTSQSKTIVDMQGDTTLTEYAAKVMGLNGFFTSLTTTLDNQMNGIINDKFYFNTLDFKVHAAPGVSGTDTITLAGNNLGITSTSFTIPQGVSFFGVITTNGSKLSSVGLSGDVALAAIQSAHIGGTKTSVAAIPEGSTLPLLLSGAIPGLALAGLRRRRR